MKTLFDERKNDQKKRVEKRTEKLEESSWSIKSASR